MDRFLDCLCDNNLESLIIEGRADKKELQEQWVIILSEYHELKGDLSDGTEAWILIRDVNRLQNHLFLLDHCIKFLTQRYSEIVATSLRKLGYPFRPENKTPFAYLNLLNEIVNRSKPKFIQLKQLLKELEEKIKSLSDKKPSRDEFENMLLEFEELQNTAYTMETLTVSKFITLEKKLLKRIDQLKARKTNARTH